MSEEKEARKPGKGASDVEELREVLSVVRGEIPALLREVIGPLRELMTLTYTPEQARERARAIAAFYKELTDAGIPKEDALQLVRDNFINPMALIRGVFSERRHRAEEEEEE